MVSLNETIPDIILAVEGADPALSREQVINLGLEEKAGANRKTLLRWLRLKVKEFPEVEVTEDVIDAPGEPPPGYEPTSEALVVPGGAISREDAEEVSATLGVIKPLMQEVDPRPCIFRFQDVDINLFPVCGIHNSGMCSPCLEEDPPVKRCRVVCFAESNKHRNIKQAQVVLKSKAIVDNPATVESIDVSEFDG